MQSVAADYVEEAEALGTDWNEALDDQVLQKVLPKIKGAETRCHHALTEFIKATESLPLSRQKAERMLEGLKTHGIVSYF